jgi:broad specificity phosphatase PhoE
MAVHITYFVHGTTTDNEQHISSGRYDVALSELGVQQSIDLRDKIQDKHFDVVFCSDLQRAFTSAKLTFEDTVKSFLIQDSENVTMVHTMLMPQTLLNHFKNKTLPIDFLREKVTRMSKQESKIFWNF